MTLRNYNKLRNYDPIGRPAVTGIVFGSFPSDGKAPLATVNFAGTETGLANSGYTSASQTLSNLLSSATLTTATYYDSYTCAHLEGFEDLYFSFSINSSYAKGLKTAEKLPYIIQITTYPTIGILSMLTTRKGAWQLP